MNEKITIRRTRTKTITSPTWFRVGDLIRNFNTLLQKMHWNIHGKGVLLCMLSFESDFCFSIRISTVRIDYFLYEDQSGKRSRICFIFVFLVCVSALLRYLITSDSRTLDSYLFLEWNPSCKLKNDYIMFLN